MKRKIAALLTFAAFTLGVGIAGAQEAPAPKKDVGWKEGQFLGDFKAKKLEGGDFDSKSMLGKKATVFVIVSPTCSLCRQEVTEFNALADQVAKKADVYVVVAANAASASRFVAQGEVKFPILVDEEYALMTAANFRVNPATVVVGADGKILKRFGQYENGQAEGVLKILP